MKAFSHAWCVLAVVAAGVVLPAGAVGQDEQTETLHVHGYLSQGYAASGELPVFGIPSGGGTLDYRSAALQFRYAATARDGLVLQLSHRRLGGSVHSTPQQAMELDWAFYQRLIGPLSLRVGRVPLPLGIYNEVRDVGTLLPFYRAPGNVYLEGFESLDGAVVEHRADVGAWSVETSLVGGEANIEFAMNVPEGPRLLKDRMTGVLGGQLWLNTPVDGVRIGGGAWRWSGDLAMPGLENAKRGRMWTASAEAELDRAYVRGEHQNVRFGDLAFRSVYGQAGFDIGAGFSLNGQAEASQRDVDFPFGRMETKMARDLALGLNFSPTAALVLKLEGHQARGYFFDRYVDERGPAGESRYAIASVSVSF